MNPENKTLLLFGLKWKRFSEWLCDLKAEKPGLIEFYLMSKLMLKIFFVPRTFEYARKNYFQRLLICHRCPIFDKRLKRCRKGELGCGCYVPFKALAPVDCWLRETDKSAGWGLAEYQGKPWHEFYFALFVKIFSQFTLLVLR